VAVHGKADNKNWTDLLLKGYNIRKITVTPYLAAANGAIQRGYRPITDTVSKLTGRSDDANEMWIDYLPAVLWADSITIRSTTAHSQFRLMFG
jgi:hypothetical protein